MNDEVLAESKPCTIQAVIRTGDGLGPGCCVIQRANFNMSLSNVGDRATCDKIAADFSAGVVSYTPGHDCP